MAGCRPDERPLAADRRHAPAGNSGVHFQLMGTDNNIDWTAAATPQSEEYGPGLSRQAKFQSLANKAAQLKSDERKADAIAVTRHHVIDTLLGDNNLAAFDAGGGDPYNATGRQFRR